MRNQTACDFHTTATGVRTSVWPAEYTVAIPKIESASAVSTSGQSMGKRRTPMSAVDHLLGHRRDLEVRLDDLRRDRGRSGAVAAELDHHRDDDLGVGGGRESDEPRVIELDPVLELAALPRARLARQLDALDGGCRRGAALD